MKKMTLIQRFSILCLITLVLIGIAFGKKVTSILEENMLSRTKYIVAKFVSDVAKKELIGVDLVSPKVGGRYAEFSKIVAGLSLGPNIERVKIWNKDHIVVWADDERLVGQRFQDNDELAEALQGEIVSEISVLDKAEHKFERGFERLLELYVPINFDDQDDIKTVFETYVNLDPLYRDIGRQKRSVWILTFFCFNVLYLLLFGIVWRASRRIETQTEEIVKSEKKYRSLVQSAQDGIIVINNNGEVILFNEAAKKMFGYSTEELAGKSLAMLISEQYRTKHYTATSQFFQTGKTTNTGKTIELEGVRRQGEVFPIEMSLSISGEADNLIVTAIIRDISERRHAEKMLFSERDKLQGVLNAIGEGIYIVNSNFIIEYHNEIFKNNFGDHKGEKCFTVFMQLDAPCKFCLLEKTIELLQIQHMEISIQNGKIYDMIFSPFTDVDGGVKVTVLLRDVTERRGLEAVAMRAAHLASIGELAAGVAHEINNPINGIINYAQIINDEYEARDIHSEYSREIITEGRRITTIVKNLLTFAREKKEDLTPTNVQNIYSDAFMLFSRQFQKSSITTKVDFPEDLPMVMAHSQQIQQVFINILSNARYALNQKFPEHHKDKSLEITANAIMFQNHTYVRTTFHDKGAGVPANKLNSICDPFFSTKPRGEGTGLGLSISHNIINDHGGRLLFESQEGKYTKVMVDLPAVED